jgi:hypothetical protein
MVPDDEREHLNLVMGDALRLAAEGRVTEGRLRLLAARFHACDARSTREAWFGDLVALYEVALGEYRERYPILTPRSGLSPGTAVTPSARP